MDVMGVWPEGEESVLAHLFESAMAKSAPAVASIDPLQRLLDPSFTNVLWEYEYSRTEPEIPGSLHAKQSEVLESDARHRWLFWGNQVGKTTIGAVDVVLLALGRHPHQKWKPPVTQWASALTWELWEKILLPELLTWIPKDRLIKSPEPHVHSMNRDILLRADNGKISRITGKAAQQGAAMYQSARVHQVWLDEEHPEAVWNEMQPRLLRHGGRTISTMTPLKGFTWVYHRVYEPWKKGSEDERVFCSHAGLVDNPAIGSEEIKALDEALKHAPAQLAARKYGHFVKPEGLALNFDPDKHNTGMDDDEVMQLAGMGQVFAGIDFGSWRFAFNLFAVDRDGVVTRIGEIYDQRQSGDVEGSLISPLERRAKAVIEMAGEHGLETLRIWGDAANPTDMSELNSYFVKLKSKLRVVPVAMENKIRTASVDRINDLLGRGALRFRKGVMNNQVWMMGYNTASSGTPVEGSRLMWEMQNWAYPKPADGKAQKQDPDDNTADGADAIASMRYAIMSWWKAAKQPSDDPQTMQEARERLKEQQKKDGKGDDVLERAGKAGERRDRRLEKLMRKMRQS
jgi:phage terminase large subunit-like protein